jgi:hypothetical protein
MMAAVFRVDFHSLCQGSTNDSLQNPAYCVFFKLSFTRTHFYFHLCCFLAAAAELSFGDRDHITPKVKNICDFIHNLCQPVAQIVNTYSLWF